MAQVRDYDLGGKDEMIGEVTLDLQGMLKAAFLHRERNNYLQLTTPFRLVEGAMKDWKIAFGLKRDGKKMGEVVMQIEARSRRDLAGISPRCRPRGRADRSRPSISAHISTRAAGAHKICGDAAAGWRGSRRAEPAPDAASAIPQARSPPRCGRDMGCSSVGAPFALYMLTLRSYCV